MEFLIIVFVIITIFSSISKRFKEEAKKKSPFDPWSFDSDSLEDDYNNLKKQEVKETEEDFIEEEKSKIDLSEKQPEIPVPEAYPGGQNINKYRSSTEQDKEQDPVNIDKVKENGNQLAEKTSAPETQLKALLTGRELPLTVVATEILGPPKARKPYSRKNN